MFPAMTDTLADAAPAVDAEAVRTLTQDGPAVRLFLVDGSGYIFRAYHALPPLTRKSDGMPVGAVQGFCNMLWKLLRETKQGDAPTHLAVIFDASEKTFRNDLYDQYKAHRPPPPEDLVPQEVRELRPLPRTYGFPSGPGGVVLIGDAAHAMPHHLGQGACLAFEDAATLRSLVADAEPGVSLTGATSPSSPGVSWTTRIGTRLNSSMLGGLMLMSTLY